MAGNHPPGGGVEVGGFSREVTVFTVPDMALFLHSGNNDTIYCLFVLLT